MQVYIVSSLVSYERMFESRGHVIAHNMEDADLVVFTGGQDVHPSLYGEALHPATHTNRERDVFEKGEYLKACELGKKVVGICRGAQLLNVLNGGTLYQDVDGHRGSHVLIDHMSQQEVTVTSTHHQMMRPPDRGIVIAYANESSCRQYVKDNEIITCTSKTPDVEVVLFPDTDTLCFQPHPEMVHQGHPCQEYFFFLLADQLEIA